MPRVGCAILAATLAVVGSTALSGPARASGGQVLLSDTFAQPTTTSPIVALSNQSPFPWPKAIRHRSAEAIQQVKCPRADSNCRHPL